ncbi:MAG: Ppx/GppA family phosphatase, partial [Nitrospirales bacterium]|nr:Ppx/GppA family phosphatase [Nitrospirales bacterium]
TGCLSPAAAIDVGSNTLRLLIGCVREGRIARIRQERSVTRLGRDMQKTGVLNREGIEASIRTLALFKELLDGYGALPVRAVGTSALREAADSHSFIERAREETGIGIVVISGEREAELTLKGLRGDVVCGAAQKPDILVDLGGGSTEMIVCGGTVSKGSIPIGAVKLFNLFLHSDPPTAEELHKAIQHVYKEINRYFLKNNLRSVPLQSGELIATGGTAATVAAIDLGLESYDGDRVHRHRITYLALKTLHAKLSAMTIAERENIRGMGRDRADIIVPGMLILLILMEIMKRNRVTISDYGLLEGIISEGPHPFMGQP